MKITLEPEKGEDNLKKEVFENVYQFTIGGWFMNKKLYREVFRKSVIQDKTELIGITKMLEEDIKNHNG